MFHKTFKQPSRKACHTPARIQRSNAVLYFASCTNSSEWDGDGAPFRQDFKDRNRTLPATPTIHGTPFCETDLADPRDGVLLTLSQTNVCPDVSQEEK